MAPEAVIFIWFFAFITIMVGTAIAVGYVVNSWRIDNVFKSGDYTYYICRNCFDKKKIVFRFNSESPVSLDSGETCVWFFHAETEWIKQNRKRERVEGAMKNLVNTEDIKLLHEA